MQAAFFEAIGRQPDEDGPRLIYADWLEEQEDEPHARFIRMQCELARLEPHSVRHIELEAKCRTLLARHGSRWTPESWSASARYLRGFPESLEIHISDFVSQHEKLREQAPLHSIAIWGLSRCTAELAAAPELQTLRRLRLTVNNRRELRGLIQLCQSPSLAHVSSLQLMFSYYEWNPELLGTLRGLGERMPLEELRIDLFGVPDGHAEFPELNWGRQASFPRLRRLWMRSRWRNGLPGVLPMGLFGINAPQLESLRLDGLVPAGQFAPMLRLPLHQVSDLYLHNPTAAPGFCTALAEHDAFANLRRLNLADCCNCRELEESLLNAERSFCCEELLIAAPMSFASPNFHVHLLEAMDCSRLRRFEAVHCGPHEWIELMRSKAPLESLRLTNCNLATGGLPISAAELNPSVSETLRSLEFSRTNLTQEVFTTLTAGRFPQLTHLAMHQTHVGLPWRKACKQLCESGAFPSLALLQLDGSSRFGAVGLSMLAEQGEFPELRVLELRESRVSDLSIRRVLTTPRMPQLLRLRLESCQGLSSGEQLLEEFGERVEF
ncbi:MAG: TIGR02996 domain-containing protein [Planctomycetales bacterium]|nr:TIGR02996 domain-containing protein [Planctomycetales bacterium]